MPVYRRHEQPGTVQMGGDIVVACEATNPLHFVVVEELTEPAPDRRLDHDHTNTRVHTPRGSALENALDVVQREGPGIVRQRHEVQIAQHLGAIA